jgi:hypothetical protein
VNGDGSDTESAGGFFEKIELPLVPDDGSEFVADYVFGLIGKDAADNEDARIWTEATSFNALFDAGDTEPINTGADCCRAAKRKRVTVSIRLDDSEKLYVRGCELREDTAVVLEVAGGDFYPARTTLYETAQAISLGESNKASIALSD